MLRAAETHPRLTTKLFSKYSNLCDHTSTSRRTDRHVHERTQTTCSGNTYPALPYSIARRGKNDINDQKFQLLIQDDGHRHNNIGFGHRQPPARFLQNFVSPNDANSPNPRVMTVD